MNLKALLSITLVCLLGSLQTLFAQNIGSEIKEGKKYIKHKVQAKETVFKIAQTYKVSQEDLIDVNPEIANTLKKDAIILIPTKEEVKKEELAKDNPTPNNLQSPNADAEFEMVETKYTVKKGESLTKIAKIHKVEIEDIKKWNELSNDLIKPGQELIVGISTRKTNKKNNESKNSLAVNSKTVDKNAKKNLKSSAEDELLNVEEKTVEHKVKVIKKIKTI